MDKWYFDRKKNDARMDEMKKRMIAIRQQMWLYNLSMLLLSY
jgi:hypothetical protein